MGCHRNAPANRSAPSPDSGSAGRPGAPALEPVARPGRFADNPIIYFVITDRFFNGNPINDHSYGRSGDGKSEIGTFHGGDLAGLTQKLNDGYFQALGVNGLWITAPYEQIHGWVVGGNNEFHHYAYHGYYALDYTVLDRNMGTGDELRTFIDTAHAHGIRVIFDVVMNHPGYADITSLAEYGIDVLWPGWENATIADYHSFIDYNDFDFQSWWGPDWVRSSLPGYQTGPAHDDRLMQLAYLPDFKTESDKPVELPIFLRNKPDTRARSRPGYTVRAYLVEWLSSWVREYGVDGFRCDTVKHVELETWSALKSAGTEALRQWKSEHPDKVIDSAGFWMTGEVFPHGVDRDEYFDHGFDSLINFDLQPRALEMDMAPASDWSRLDALYSEYAAKLSADPDFNVLSYLSSHDTQLFPRDRLLGGGTILMLAPGGVQIFYGDETARPTGPAPSSDPQQATRSAMSWSAIDADVLAHWQALGRFRRRHVALARGRHQRLGEQPYVFARIHPDDRVVVAIGASGATRVTVGDVFAEGELVRDAYTGEAAKISGGKALLHAAKHGVMLVEKMIEK